MSHNKIELSENQLAPAKAKPEDFVILSGDTTHEDVSGQRENDKEADAKSSEKFNRGSNYNDTITI